MRKLLALLLTIILSGCNYEPRQIRDYPQLITDFDKKLTEHMPEKISNWSVAWGSGLKLTDSSRCLYMTHKYFDEETIEEIMNANNFASFIKYKASDSCILTLKTYGNLNGVTEPKTDCKEVIAIPQFVYYESRYDSIQDSRVWEFNKNIETVILDQSINPVSDLNNEHLNSIWGTGYTKGISLNRSQKKITYWVMTW